MESETPKLCRACRYAPNVSFTGLVPSPALPLPLILEAHDDGSVCVLMVGEGMGVGGRESERERGKEREGGREGGREGKHAGDDESSMKRCLK
jgi:hypothetical protein